MSGSGVYYSGMFIIDSTWNHHISQVWTMDAGFAGPKLVGWGALLWFTNLSEPTSLTPLPTHKQKRRGAYWVLPLKNRLVKSA